MDFPRWGVDHRILALVLHTVITGNSFWIGFNRTNSNSNARLGFRMENRNYCRICHPNLCLSRIRRRMCCRFSVISGLPCIANFELRSFVRVCGVSLTDQLEEPGTVCLRLFYHYFGRLGHLDGSTQWICGSLNRIL